MLVATPGTTPLSLGWNLIPTSFMLTPPPLIPTRIRGSTNRDVTVTSRSTSPRLMCRVRYISETEVQL